MSARAQRKAESEQRRRDWRIRWANVGLEATMANRDSIDAIAEDVQRIITAEPQRRAEVMQALIEFRARLNQAIAATEKTVIA